MSPSDFVRNEKKSILALKMCLAYVVAILSFFLACMVSLFGIFGVSYITKIWHTIIPAETLDVGNTRISEKDGMKMVYVPAGEFEMGSDDETNDEKPVHVVYLDSYWIDQTEVTTAMYAKCVEDQICDPPSSNGSITRDRYYDNPKFDQFPVIFVSWNDAQRYCMWAERRLPTEAEWEKAASWNEEKQEKYVYPWGNTFDYLKLNSCDRNCPDGFNNKASDDGYSDTAPVGSYKDGKSPYGTYDMAGNV